MPTTPTRASKAANHHSEDAPDFPEAAPDAAVPAVDPDAVAPAAEPAASDRALAA